MEWPRQPGGIIDAATVLAANRAFYAAFEARDLDAMSDLWDRSERAVCTHPGWPVLRGWPAISASWFTLFTNGQHLQFIVTDEVVALEGTVAWVTCVENLLGDGAGPGGSVAALNVFALVDGAWRVVAHHGSPILARH
ncbi:MAG: nuclear transport factor 2 family protein [Acidimicrobiales bacterium]